MKEKKIKNLLILGSTGSIGRQAIEVCLEENWSVYALSCKNSIEILKEQILLLQPSYVWVEEKEARNILKNWLIATQEKQGALSTELVESKAVWKKILQESTVDRVLAAMSGFAGLQEALWCIEAGKSLALANKESLVAAGELVLKKAQEHGVDIIPVDSEHSAIFQCVAAYSKEYLKENLNKVILTASGGPLREKKKEDLARVKPQEALHHPTWSMGKKISIDSATLMNKALEIIEAYHLFHVKAEQIEVLVHPQSYVHSFIQWKDGVMLAELGKPSMKKPIRFALAYPERSWVKEQTLAFEDLLQKNLSFEKVREEIFPSIQYAKRALQCPSYLPLVLNAVNEVAVALYLEEKILLTDIFTMVDKALTEAECEIHTKGPPNLASYTALKSIHDFWQTWARAYAKSYKS